MIETVFAETFNAALKKAYETNPELNAERESINISEQELKITKSSYLPTITLEGSRSEEDTNKKIGNAVKRNRIRRKLKAITGKILKIKGAINTNYTYIIICKTKSYTEKYDKIFLEMQKSFKKLN